ncbi:MAG TPA: DUF4129 domain-containing protein [Sphingomicrobium sp.]
MEGNSTAAGGPDQFAGAYKALRADPSVQFNLTPPTPDPQSPQWLRDFFNWLGKLFEPVAKFLAWIGSFFPQAPYARFLLWTVIVAGVAALLWILYNRLVHGEWRIRLPRLAHADIEFEPEWAPDHAPARSWLEEAEALARQGRYAEAIHHLLFRSIEDIARRRPNLVRPALTSRELAGSAAVPERARDLFAGIARVVERSLFGGRPVGEQDWIKARDSYAEFALAGSWR